MSLDENVAPSSRLLTVTELTARIKQMLEVGFSRVEVSGEVSRLTRPSSGHLYFTIKDAHAAIAAVIWRSTAMRLQFLPQEGEAYLFSGHISLYEPRGAYQLIISRIEAAGAGKLAAEFERRKQACAERGWFDSERKKPLPALPQHVGIVTSATAAAFEDVKKVLATRPAWLQLTLAPALVQGRSAPASIAAAINRLAVMDAPPDVILLVRGGGSIEDLWCFNDEAVVKAVVDCPVPIISGIGHEIDTTLADLAADRRAATPSNAAEICCPARDELRGRIPRAGMLRQLFRQQVEQHRRIYASLLQRHTHVWQRSADARYYRLEQLRARLRHAAVTATGQARLLLRRMEKRLRPLQPVKRLQRQRLVLGAEQRRLQQQMGALLQQKRRVFDDIATQLVMQRQSLQEKRQQLNILRGKLGELDPTCVLERGYSMAIGSDGGLITHAAGLSPGERMQVRFRDGAVNTTVDAVEVSS